jgi:hypothetical protein
MCGVVQTTEVWLGSVSSVPKLNLAAFEPLLVIPDEWTCRRIDLDSLRKSRMLISLSFGAVMIIASKLSPEPNVKVTAETCPDIFCRSEDKGSFSNGKHEYLL